MESGAPKPAEDDQAPASAAPTVVVRMSHAGSGGSSTSRMTTRVQHSSTVSFEGDDTNGPNSGSRGDDDSGNAAFTPSSSDNSQPRRLSVTVSRQNSMGSSTGPQGKRGYSTRVKKPRPLSGSSAAGSSVFDGRASMISRMSSTVGLRDTFFGGRREDPLELSTSQEFDLTVIDESGGMEENIVGQILTPDVGGWSSWSAEGWIVVVIGVATVVITASLAVAMPTLDGFTIDPGLVFGSLQTLILCAIVFVTYHGVQSFQAHPNPLILYKCVIDMVLALRFLLDPMLQDWGVYTPGERNSCNYLSGVTQFLYLSSDSWYFALIVDLYTSLTNPFTSVKADRKKYKIAIYSIAAFMGFMTATVKGAHGFSDGTYCWTNRGSSHERNFFKLNVASWLVFYDWMILYYIAGIAVLVFCAKRLRSGLRDTLQTRRDMLRNGAISIMSFTGYWTIVFMWYAVSFHTRTAYRADGTLGPSKIFRSFAYTLSGRGAVDYFVWFMLNRPSLMRKNWLKFSSESADKKFSAQLNTALQHELIYFTIEGMTRAIQMADDELIFSRDRSPTRDLVESSEIFRDRESSNPPILGGGEHGRQRHSELNTGNLQESPVGSSHTSSDHKKNSKKKHPVKGDSGTFDIPRIVPPKKKDPRASPATLSPAGTGVGGASPHRKGSTNSSYNHIRFTPYKPDEFAELRSAYGISASDFQKSFETSTKPNISEGASGAFIFFSGDRKFIVKSMSESECRFLCEIAENYVEFLIANPSSLITKFYGCFKITLYEKKFYFIVMENLFDVAEQGVQIHHRFDIKGSWVNRSYKRPRRGAKVKCRHCSMQFKYGAKKASLQCPNVVGLHEPNVVLKDNDLRTRMRIGREAGRELYELLCEDSLFLCRLGIMDYSLLLGVVDIEFMVDQPKANSRRNTVTSANADGTNQSFMTTMSSSSFVEDIAGDVVQSAKAALQSLAHEPAAPRDRNDSELHNGPSVRSLTQMDPNGNPLGHSHSRSKKSMRRSKRIFGPGYYYIGVIDILQTWTLKKRLERFWKVNFQRCDAEGLSAIEPEQYQRRFEAKLREIIALPKDYQVALNQRRKTHSVGGFNFVSASSRGGARGVQSTRGSVEAPGSAAMRTSSSHEIAYDDDEVDIDMLIEGGGRSGRGAGTRGRSAGRMTIEEVNTSDSQTNSSSSAIDDSEDVEQAQRNPEPILLHFSQMLVGSSTRSNITNVSSQRDAV